MRIIFTKNTLASFAIIALVILNAKLSLADGQLFKVATEELRKRQEALESAKLNFNKGNYWFERKNYRQALQHYRDAYNGVQTSPSTIGFKKQVAENYTKAVTIHAEEIMAFGRRQQAKELINSAKKINPDSTDKRFKKLVKNFEDPQAFPPALDEKLAQKTQKVTQLLQTANHAYQLGDFDRARELYYQTLNIDKYNKSARRGLERTDKEMADYQETAYTQTRAELMRDVAASWEMPINPEKKLSNASTEIFSNKLRSLKTKADKIIFPNVQFSSTPLEEVVTYLRQKSKELDTTSTANKISGINLVIDESQSALAGESYRDKPITFSMQNAPLNAILEYTARLAGMKVIYEQSVVLLVPRNFSNTKFASRTWKIPPFFLTQTTTNETADDDPFSIGQQDDNSINIKRTDVKSFLQENGVGFPEGSSVYYSFATSTLASTNTEANLEQIDSILGNFRTNESVMVNIQATIMDISEEDAGEESYDWLFGGFNVPGSDRVFGSGGTYGNQRNIPTSPSTVYPIGSPASNIATGENISTAGLRSGELAIDNDSLDELINTSFEPITPLAPATFAFGGVFTDPQFQGIIRALKQKTGKDQIIRPAIIVKSGQSAKIESIREMLYPTEYDPPQVPDEYGNRSITAITFDGATGQVLDLQEGTGSSVPVTPATPTTFETKNTGVTLEVNAAVHPDNYYVDLDLNPTMIQFEGFIDYGQPITDGVNLLTENQILMPVFKQINSKNNVTVADGQTVVVGSLVQDRIVKTEDRVPLLGSLPMVGKFFRSEVEQRNRRHIIIFVTVRLIDSGGNPINKTETNLNFVNN